MQQTWQVMTDSASATETLGEAMGKRLRGSEVIELVSDLGGGKTTFVRGLARGLGSTDKVSSPTFTISQVYKTNGAPEVLRSDGVQGASEQRTEPYQQYGEGAAELATPQSAESASRVAGSAGQQAGAAQELWLYHFDFYRLGEAGIMSDELAEAVADPQAVVVVEWGDIVGTVLPAERITMRIVATGEHERAITLTYPERLAYVIPKEAP